MPFVTKAHRIKPDPMIPGDRCYTNYKYLVDYWKKEPRWTTADRLFSEILVSKSYCDKLKMHTPCEFCTALDLAWQVFFIKYVMKYENKKERENGTI